MQLEVARFSRLPWGRLSILNGCINGGSSSALPPLHAYLREGSIAVFTKAPVPDFQVSRSRGFSSSAASDVPGLDPETLKSVSSLLQTTAVLQLREELKHIADERPCVTLAEFEKLAKDFGVASSEEELLRITDALSTSGVIFRFRNIIYLRPKDVGAVVLQVLPESYLTAAQIEHGLKEVKEELRPLQDKLEGIEARAARRARMVMWGGLGTLVGQLGLYARLTYYELSWDVMEPLAYFTSGLFMVMAYLYFMSAGKEFTYENLHERVFQRYRNKLIRRTAFDEHRYKELIDTVARYERRVSLQKFLRLAH